MKRLSRRDFLKFSGSTFVGLAFSPFLSGPDLFHDAEQVRVATNSISVYSEPNDQSLIVRQHFRDEIVHIYKEIDAGAPAYNPIWYRVWGGYIYRGRVQKVKTIFNEPLTSFPDESRQPAELTVPYSQAMRYTKTYGWQPNLRLYYGSVHWIDGVDEGPIGEPWYRIYDELLGFPYQVQAIHLRPIPFEEWSPISPDIPLEDKRIEVNLGTQILSAYENEQLVFKTNISSGITTARRNPNDLSTQTPTGEFRIITKYPSKHMGNGSLFATPDDYELPGVPWTTFFHEAGYAFHGTYWHDNYGTPMSRGCVNMRIAEARWLFRWVHPVHVPERIYTPGYGTLVNIHP